MQKEDEGSFSGQARRTVRYHAGMHAPRGYSLIEVVIALFIVGVIIVLSTAMLRAAPLTKRASSEQIALKIAENEIETLRAVGYSSLPASGAFTDSLMTSIPSGSGTIAISDFNSTTKQVGVTVSWQNPNASTTSITLTTLVAKVGGLK